jgi:hypothetical protein
VKKPKPHPRRPFLSILVVECDGLHQLMVQSLAGTNPAGMRLERKDLMPVTEFSFFDPADAEVARKKLQEYLDRV